jgi:hypothetical protein
MRPCWSLPPVVDPGQKKGRGRPPKYGKDRIDLARRAAQTRGWQTGLFSLYGRLVVKKYKTFLATYQPVGGVIRVVLVRAPDRWVAYFSTDPDLSVAPILETVADRSALEQVFHDVKEEDLNGKIGGSQIENILNKLPLTHQRTRCHHGRSLVRGSVGRSSD